MVAPNTSTRNSTNQLLDGVLEGSEFAVSSSLGSRMSFCAPSPSELRRKLSDEAHYPFYKFDWKPDITTLNEYQIVKVSLLNSESGPSLPFLRCLDLLAHKNMRMRIMDRTRKPEVTKQILQTLDGQSHYHRYKSYEVTPGYEGLHGGEFRGLRADEFFQGNVKYDLAIFISGDPDGQFIKKCVSRSGYVMFLTGTNGYFALCKCSPGPGPELDSMTMRYIGEVGSPEEHFQKDTKLFPLHSIPNELEDIILDKVLVVTRHPGPETLAKEVLQKIASMRVCKFLLPTSLETLHELAPEQIKGSKVILLADWDGCLLSELSEHELTSIQKLASNASFILWIIERPESAMAPAFTRVLRIEYPSLKLVDLNLSESFNAANIVWSTLLRSLQPDYQEFNLRCFRDMIFISRLMPYKELNSPVLQRVNVSFSSKKSLQLFTDQPGDLKTAYFKNDSRVNRSLSEEMVDVELLSASMGFQDLTTPSRKISVVGTVRRIGSKVTRVSKGDTIIGIGITPLRTHMWLHQGLCVKVLNQVPRKFLNLATIPIAYCTAILCLREYLDIEAGSSVIIHSAATSDIGIAIVRTAHIMHCKVFATADSLAERDFLHDRLCLPTDRIFGPSSQGLLLKPAGDTVFDIIINPNATEYTTMIPADYQDRFGRYVNIVNRAKDSECRVPGALFLGLNIGAIDLSMVFNSLDKVALVLDQIMHLIHDRKIFPIKPITSCHISQLRSAKFREEAQTGKLVVNFQYQQDDLVLYQQPCPQPSFKGDHTYLLVGGFGKIGCSLARDWLSLGASSFIFLSRSGPSSQEAQKLVSNLSAAGALVQVIRGDVLKFSDVVEAVKAAPTPIRGVVNLAVRYNSTPFSEMTGKYWHSVLDPKVRGIINIRNALGQAGHNAEFVLAISSLNSVMGVSTQSHYAAASAFLDSHPGTISLNIGCVSSIGSLSGAPRIRAHFLRTGIHNMTVANVIEAVRKALLTGSGTSGPMIITGMDMTQLLRELSAKGEKDFTLGWGHDVRFQACIRVIEEFCDMID